MTDTNPFAPPETQQQSVERGPIAALSLRGIGRLPYFLLMIAMLTPVLFAPIATARGFPDILGTVVTVTMIATQVVGVVLRLTNIGTKIWWCALLFVPAVSLMLIAACLILPTDFVTTKKLDGVASVGLFAMALAAVALFLTKF